jgi:hypothetical protein
MSRWGGFRKGRIRYITNWDQLKSASSFREETAADAPQGFSYVDAQGIWNLRSTMEFPKSNAVLTQAPSYTLGLSNSLLTISGQLDAWTQRAIDISAYAGATVRLAFGYLSGSSFTGDIQLDAINLDGNSYSFENTGDNFQTSVSGESSYSSVSWNNLATGASNGRWNVDSGGTTSSNTARTDAANGSYYVYAETSGVTNSYFWLRSPQITLGSSPTLSFYEARLGATIGTLDVYLDVIS